jgi:hypothetical protein
MRDGTIETLAFISPLEAREYFATAVAARDATYVQYGKYGETTIKRTVITK